MGISVPLFWRICCVMLDVVNGPRIKLRKKHFGNESASFLFLCASERGGYAESDVLPSTLPTYFHWLFSSPFPQKKRCAGLQRHVLCCNTDAHSNLLTNCSESQRLFNFTGFKRGADPGMPEPTVLRLALPLKKLCCLYDIRSSAWRSVKCDAMREFSQLWRCISFGCGISNFQIRHILKVLQIIQECSGVFIWIPGFLFFTLSSFSGLALLASTNCARGHYHSHVKSHSSI